MYDGRLGIAANQVLRAIPRGVRTTNVPEEAYTELQNIGARKG